MKIGFIGLGKMGTAFTRNLLASGHKVTVWNRSPDAAKPLRDEGARVAENPQGACESAIVFSMLADDAAIRSSLIESGALASMPKGAIHVGLATVSIALADELTELHAKAGTTYVSAPLFGRPDAVVSRMANAVAAGPTVALDTIEPLLRTSTQKVWRIGEKPSQANAVKLGGNFMIACALQAMAESLSLVRSHGVDAEKMIEIMTGTLFAAPVYKNYGPMIAAEKFTPAGFVLKLGLKDVRLALQAAETHSVSLPFGSVLRDQFLEAIAHGDGEKDWSAVAGVQFRRAHLPI